LLNAVVGAGWALAVSFVVLAFAWRTSRFGADTAGRPVHRWIDRVVSHGATHWAIRVFGLALTGYVAWAALFGADSAVNPSLGVFYVYLWVGMVPLSLLLGNVWPLLSPIRTVHLLLTRAIGARPRAGLGEVPALARLLAGSCRPDRVRLDRTGLP